MDKEQQLANMLGSKRWRLTSGEFYKIKDKNGNIVPFIPNPFQVYYFKNKHTRNIILKARQLGFSTAIQIDMLDDALFIRNQNIGIIAQDKGTAQLIRKDKIEVALDNLPDYCSHYWQYEKENEKEISFNNGSSIYVSNSFRGGTLQRLHISEYGKICVKYPEKAKEIQSGAIESVAIDQQVVIESTAEGSEGDFFDKCESYSKMVGKPLTPLDYKFFFFPRWVDDSYSYNGVVVTIPKEVDEYFLKLENEYGIILNEGQKNWYYLKLREKKDLIKREYPSFYKEAFEIAIEGAYWASEINILYQQNRVTRVLYDPNLLVYTCWDLGGAGGGDDCSIRFFQIYGNEIRWIDYFEGTGYSMLYILKNIIDTKPYRYSHHIGPHDLEVHELMSGKTRMQTAKENGYTFTKVLSPAGAVSQRIEIVRNMFTKMRFDSKNCSAGLNKIKNYRRKRNDSTGSWMDEVAKNGSQHSADALAYGCQYISESILPNITKQTTGDTVIPMGYKFIN